MSVRQSTEGEEKRGVHWQAGSVQRALRPPWRSWQGCVGHRNFGPFTRMIGRHVREGPSAARALSSHLSTVRYISSSTPIFALLERSPPLMRRSKLAALSDV